MNKLACTERTKKRKTLSPGDQEYSMFSYINMKNIITGLKPIKTLYKEYS